MSDLVNALSTQSRSGSVLDAIAHPAQVNPLAEYAGAAKTAESIFGVREKQADQAWGQALQASTDANGNVDYQKAQGIAAGNPAAAQGMLRALPITSSLRTDQINQTAGTSKLIGQSAMTVLQNPSDANVNSVFDNLKANGMPAGQVEQERQRVLSMTPDQRTQYAYQHGLNSLEQLHQVIGQTTGQNVGGQIVPLTVTPGTRPGQPGTLQQGGGAVTTTLSPSEALQGGIVYPATADDVRAGRAGAVGQDVHVSGPEMITRFGLSGLLPPGARSESSGGGVSGGVVGADGKPVSPTNPPRLLNVPGQPKTPSPPATPGAVPGAPAVGGNTGFGAAVNASPAAPAAPLPVPPVPPANPPPAPPATVAPPPPPSNLPPNAPTAALGGGVPVASTNALAPNIGAPSPPSALVPGDVNAILQGMRARQGAPSTGTQTAYNTIATGPGTEEAQGYKTSADKLAADNVAAANFQSAQFPYVQALKTYGEGTKTGPTTEFWNQVAGTIRTPLAKLGLNIGALDDNTQRQDALGKWLASIQSGNPISAKSDAELAQVLKGSASTHINETTGADMVKSGLALMRMNVAANREWNSNPALQQQFGTYLSYLGDYNNRIDPRAFAVDTYNPDQVTRLRAQLRSGSEADATRFENSLALARRNGMIGGAGSQAMP